MPITPEQNIADLEKIIARAAQGAAVAADAMARYIAERTALDTLTRKRLSPGQYHVARPGDPPAMMSGTLAGAMYTEPASGGLRASAIAGNDDKRARLFEYGGCVLKSDSGMLRWRDTGRPGNPGGFWSHWSLRVDVEHPFLGPTTDEAIDDGELQRVAIEAFREYDP
jgi:hypothetical protein